jgi:hypothetical protein
MFDGRNLVIWEAEKSGQRNIKKSQNGSLEAPLLQFPVNRVDGSGLIFCAMVRLPT